MSAKLPPEKALRRAVAGLPVKVELAGGTDSGGDYAVRLDAGGHSYHLRARWVGQGWPSELKRSLPEVATGRPDWPADLVATARRFSRGALEWLASVDANWADESGQAKIFHQPALAIAREPGSDVTGDVADRSIRWTRSAVEIAEHILTNTMRHGADDHIRTGEIAATTGWSPPQVSQVLHMFDAAGWTARLGGRSGPSSWREVVDASVFLDAWADHLRRQEPEVVGGHRITNDLMRFAYLQLAPALEALNVEWALTGWGALELLAPLMSATPQLQVYVADEAFDTVLPRLLYDLGIRQVSDGARFEFRRSEAAMLRDEASPPSDPPVWVASVPRVYADLLGLGGRGTDAAAHLREVTIGF